jgi:hypothetical protein
MEEVFGTKELYDVSLKTTYPMRVGNREYEEDETLLYFDRLEIATLDTVKSRIAAVGGFDNRPQVIWEQTKQINYTMRKGVLSKICWAIMSNSQIFSADKETPMQINHVEELESNDNGEITLKYNPVKLFLYDKKTSEKIVDYTIDENVITISAPYKEVIADYKYNYYGDRDILKVGKRLLEGFLKLEGKLELKDDKDGLEKTAVLVIPKITLVTDLSMRLGTDAQPLVGNFEMIGFPVGSRGDSSVCSITFLEENLRSDI